MSADHLTKEEALKDAHDSYFVWCRAMRDQGIRQGKIQWDARYDDPTLMPSRLDHA